IRREAPRPTGPGPAPRAGAATAPDPAAGVGDGAEARGGRAVLGELDVLGMRDRTSLIAGRQPSLARPPGPPASREIRRNPRFPGLLRSNAPGTRSVRQGRKVGSTPRGSGRPGDAVRAS